MDNQHRKIKGYRDLTQAEIDLMNEIKQKGAELGELHEKVVRVLRESTVDEPGLNNPHIVAESFRWAAIAKSDFQTGLMALTRAVAAPEFF